MPTKIPVAKYLKDDLFDEVGIQNITPEERAQFMVSIAEVVQRRIEFRVVDSLTDGQKDELEGLLSREEVPGSDILKFFETALPDFDRIAEDEAAKYKKELIDRFKA